MMKRKFTRYSWRIVQIGRGKKVRGYRIKIFFESPDAMILTLHGEPVWIEDIKSLRIKDEEKGFLSRIFGKADRKYSKEFVEEMWKRNKELRNIRVITQVIHENAV